MKYMYLNGKQLYSNLTEKTSLTTNKSENTYILIYI